MNLLFLVDFYEGRIQSFAMPVLKGMSQRLFGIIKVKFREKAKTDFVERAVLQGFQSLFL